MGPVPPAVERHGGEARQQQRQRPVAPAGIGRQAFAPLHLEVTNESHMHSVPAGSETHFKVIVVSES